VQINEGVFRALTGAMGFPFAFTIIVVAGAELYTSMCAYTAAAFWEGHVGLLQNGAGSTISGRHYLGAES
jgi:formate/nitrite transporter FocA (FNT family)